MTTKKATTQKDLKYSPPLSDKEILFAHLVTKGTGDPDMSQSKRIEAAGVRVGWDKATSIRVFNRKEIHKWCDNYRENEQAELIRGDIRMLRRNGFTREDVLTLLHDLATTPVEKTKGSIDGQVSAAAEMSSSTSPYMELSQSHGLCRWRSHGRKPTLELRPVTGSRSYAKSGRGLSKRYLLHRMKRIRRRSVLRLPHPGCG
jgi:hypothetical protein